MAPRIYTLTHHAETHISVDGYEIGRYSVDVNVSAESNFELAIGWLKDARPRTKDFFSHTT